MPYVSDRQRRYMHWAKNQGKISPAVVKEFDEASRGLKLPERAKREKRSQMGNFGPGGPSSAVSGNTPTVQPTTPMTSPTVPPASTTVTKVGQAQVMFAAWADEFEKIIGG